MLRSAAKYKQVPAYAEQPDVYYDYSDDEKFSLIKYGQAECSAGLFDIIDIDQDTIRIKRGQLETVTDDAQVQKLLSDIVFSEARMLLVTRGLDPRTDDDVYNGFIKEFIEAGIVPQKFRVLIDKRRQGESLLGEKALIFELADLLNDLYKNMDDNLQFKASPQPFPEKGGAAKAQPSADAANAAAKPAGSDDIVPDVKKDFRGVACPMNFVKTKIALTPMKSGQVLEILLDDGQPIQNVPGSVKNEGHTILKTEKVNDYWKVVIKKK